MTDRFTVRVVVIGLALVAVIGLVLMGVLTYDDKSIPDAITATTSGALGALSGLLARSGSDVTVQNTDHGDNFGGGVG